MSGVIKEIEEEINDILFGVIVMLLIAAPIMTVWYILAKKPKTFIWYCAFITSCAEIWFAYNLYFPPPIV